ncbi:MAG: hypothetical protein OHK0015_42740 [Chloroflexi bacterium OHK40]
MKQLRNQRRQSASPQRYGQSYNGTQEFTCLHCGHFVGFAPEIAGVQNRNHCPYCLWSRHLDWRTPGDRLSNCQAGMRPVGLTTRRSRNKYARERDGELMIVHRCTGCGVLVLNRIAADDWAEAILELFERSASDQALAAELAASEVVLLGANEAALLSRRLFGGVIRAG